MINAEDENHTWKCVAIHNEGCESEWMECECKHCGSLAGSERLLSFDEILYHVNDQGEYRCGTTPECGLYEEMRKSTEDINKIWI